MFLSEAEGPLSVSGEGRGGGGGGRGFLLNDITSRSSTDLSPLISISLQRSRAQKQYGKSFKHNAFIGLGFPYLLYNPLIGAKNEWCTHNPKTPLNRCNPFTLCNTGCLRVLSVPCGVLCPRQEHPKYQKWHPFKPNPFLYSRHVLGYAQGMSRPRHHRLSNP